jgi:hypothetical protein
MTGTMPARRQPWVSTTNGQMFGSWTTIRSPRRSPRSSVSWLASASARAASEV